MASDVEGYPLAWPVGQVRTALREASRFRTTIGRARQCLLHELKLLGAKGIVISSNVPLRNDGLPYADNGRRYDDPGVAVYFILRGRQHAMANDRWLTVAENMSALAHTIEAMRGIARWGTLEARDQAFSGFAALPPRQTAPPGPSQASQGRSWRAVMHVDPTEPISLATAKSIFRALALRYHPDKPGGSTKAMEELNLAWEQAQVELEGRHEG